MTDRIALLGDELDLLGNVPSAARITDDAPPPTALVVGADLRDAATRRTARTRLRERGEQACEALRALPAVRHLIVAVRADGALAHSLEAMASSLATRIHAQLERRFARDIEVTVLDVSDCDDAGLLDERIRERAAERGAAHGVVVLDWSAVRDRSIGRAARELYF
jgi:hypothetical protein